MRKHEPRLFFYFTLIVNGHMTMLLIIWSLSAER